MKVSVTISVEPIDSRKPASVDHVVLELSEDDLASVRVTLAAAVERIAKGSA